VRYEFATETSFDQSVDEYYTLISSINYSPVEFAAVDLRDDLDIYHYEIGPGENPKYKFTPITSINEVTSDPYADKEVVYVTCDNFVNGTFWNKHLNQFNDPTLVPKYSDDPIILSDTDRANGPQSGYEYFKEITVETPSGYTSIGTTIGSVSSGSREFISEFELVDKTQTLKPEPGKTYFRKLEPDDPRFAYETYVSNRFNYGPDGLEFIDDVDYYVLTSISSKKYLRLSSDGIHYEPIELVPYSDLSPFAVTEKKYTKIDTSVITEPDPNTVYYAYNKNANGDNANPEFAPIEEIVEYPAGSLTEWDTSNGNEYYTKETYDIYNADRPTTTTTTTEIVPVDLSELENGFDEDVVYYTKEITSYGNHTFYLQKPGNPGELAYKFDVKVERFLKTNLKNFNIEDFNVYTNPIYDGAYGMISSDLESKFNNNCLNKPRVKTLNVIHNNLERFGGDSYARGSLSDTIEWFRTGYLDPNGYEIYTNATNTKIRLNGAVTDGNYMTAWYETGFYTPTSAKIYTNYNNTKFRYNNIDYKGFYKDDAANGVGWFDTTYKVPGETSDAGKRILTNYNNSKMMIEGNGVTISEDYKSHWFATNYTPAGIRLYTNYQNNKFNWNGITSTDDYHGHWFATNYTPAGIRLYTNYINNTWNWNGGTFTDNYTTHWFNTGRSYTVTSYYKGGYKNDWKVAAYDTVALYTNYNNTKTRAPAIGSWKWNGSDTVINLPYNHSSMAYLHQVWVNDTQHGARTDCQGWYGWDNRSDRTHDNYNTVYNTLGNPPIVYMNERSSQEDGVVRRYRRISDGATINTGCDFIRYSGSPLITSF
jgi:hypothetical protein